MGRSQRSGVLDFPCYGAPWFPYIGTNILQVAGSLSGPSAGSLVTWLPRKWLHSVQISQRKNMAAATPLFVQCACRGFCPALNRPPVEVHVIVTMTNPAAR